MNQWCLKPPLFLNKLSLAKEKLEIVNVRGGAARISRPPDPSPPQAGEDRIPFELYSRYTARKIL